MHLLYVSHYTPEERDYFIVLLWLLVHCLSDWVDTTECRAGVCSVWPMDTGVISAAGDDKHFAVYWKCLIKLIHHKYHKYI